MTAEIAKKIAEIIENAEPVADPLEKLVEKAKINPGAPFEPEVLASLAYLEEKQPAQFQTALWPSGTVERAYRRNREQAVETVLEADPVACALLAMMTGGMLRTVRAVRTQISKDLRRVVRCLEWKGTAGDLLGDLSSILDESMVRSRGWPKNPRDLGGRLRRIRSLLCTKGVEIEFAGPEGHANARTMYITAKVEAPRKTPIAPVAPLANGVSVEAPKPTDGVGTPAPKDVVPEEDEICDHED